MKNQDLHNRMLSILEVAISEGSIDEGVLGDLFAMGQRKVGRMAGALSFPNQRETFRNKIAAMRARRGIAPTAPKIKPKPESFAKDWNRGEDGRTPFQTGFAQKKAEDKADLDQRARLKDQRARLKRVIGGKQLPGEEGATDLPVGSPVRRKAIKAAARRASLSQAAADNPISQGISRFARRNIGAEEEGGPVRPGAGGRWLVSREDARSRRVRT